MKMLVTISSSVELNSNFDKMRARHSISFSKRKNDDGFVYVVFQHDHFNEFRDIGLAWTEDECLKTS